MNNEVYIWSRSLLMYNMAQLSDRLTAQYSWFRTHPRIHNHFYGYSYWLTLCDNSL